MCDQQAFAHSNGTDFEGHTVVKLDPQHLLCLTHLGEEASMFCEDHSITICRLCQEESAAHQSCRSRDVKVRDMEANVLREHIFACRASQ